MKQKTKELSTKEMVTHVEDGNCCIVDIRPVSAYNGWKLKGESNGGHIPGAKSVPLIWTRFMDWQEVLEEKRINRDRLVIVYGYSPAEAEMMIEKLTDLGYDKLLVYNRFIDGWSPNPGLPMERINRYRNLVYPDWIRQVMSGEQPEQFDGEQVVLCHVHFDNHDDYKRGHIPGAISLNTTSLESVETWNVRSPEELKKALEAHGIQHDTTVIVYGRFSSPKFREQDRPGMYAGQLAALRSAMILMYAGVRDVRILNGGLTAWTMEGYELSRDITRPQPVDDFGADIPAHPEYLVDTPGAKKIIESSDAELVSVRSMDEFIGESSGYNYIEKKGRIPGALFGNCGSDAYHMENYRNFDHTMREYHEIEEKWREGGISPDKHIVFYCGTGWRGSEAFINAWLMGWPRISLYDGGWFEWSSDPENPVEKGAPEEKVSGVA